MHIHEIHHLLTTIMVVSTLTKLYFRQSKKNERLSTLMFVKLFLGKDMGNKRTSVDFDQLSYIIFIKILIL